MRNIRVFHSETFIFLLVLFLFGSMYPSNASAGYYPLKLGETIGVEVCVSSGIKTPLILQGMGNSNKWIELLRVKSWGTGRGDCAKGESKVVLNWRADRVGSFSLSVFAPTSKKRFYPWPDGVEVASAAASVATFKVPNAIGFSMQAVENWKRQNGLKVNIKFDTALGYIHSVSEQMTKQCVVVDQWAPHPGTVVKDLPSTWLSFDIDC